MLALTWQQLGVVTQCVMAYRTLQLNTLLEVATAMLGGKVKKKARRRSAADAARQRAQQAAARGEPAQAAPGQPRDTADKLAAMGFQVDLGGG